MKKKIIALAVMGALTIPAAGYAADKKNDGTPTVYGKAHLSYGSKETKVGGTTTVDNWQLRSHASRFGIKGQRDLGGSLAVIYKFEWQIDYEQGADAALDRRNMYLGMKGGFGEVRFGRHDTPLKMAQGKFDQFGDTDADLKNAGDEDGENRLDNVLAYLGSNNGFKYQVALIPGEQNAAANGDDGPADTISAAIGYSKGPIHVMVAQDSYANDVANAAEDSLTRVVGTYKFGNMQIGALVQSGVEAPDTAAAKEDWIGLSFNMKVGGSGKIKAQYIEVEDNQANPLEGTLMAVGYDHKFDKKTKGYVMYSNLEEEQAGTTTLEDSFLGVGLVYKF
ncbi:MAG: porin [Thioalkalispiraceae bacterium]|jgi:predicted porin